MLFWIMRRERKGGVKFSRGEQYGRVKSDASQVSLRISLSPASESIEAR